MSGQQRSKQVISYQSSELEGLSRALGAQNLNTLNESDDGNSEANAAAANSYHGMSSMPTLMETGTSGSLRWGSELFPPSTASSNVLTSPIEQSSYYDNTAASSNKRSVDRGYSGRNIHEQSFARQRKSDRGSYRVPKQDGSMNNTNNFRLPANSLGSDMSTEGNDSSKKPAQIHYSKIGKAGSGVFNAIINLPNGDNVKVDRRSALNRKACPPRHWTPEEDALLRHAVHVHGERNWKSIAEMVPGRNHTQCLQRWSKVLTPGLKKGQWSTDEDELLCSLATEHINRNKAEGNPNKKLNWGNIGKAVPGRTAKQCRERWVNHLNPEIKKCEWTPEEDAQMKLFYEKFPHKWATISKFLPGRTENAVKIRWKSIGRDSKSKAYSSNFSRTPVISSLKMNKAVHQPANNTPAAIPRVPPHVHYQNSATMKQEPLFDPLPYNNNTSFGLSNNSLSNTNWVANDPEIDSIVNGSNRNVSARLSHLNSIISNSPEQTSREQMLNQSSMGNSALLQAARNDSLRLTASTNRDSIGSANGPVGTYSQMPAYSKSNSAQLNSSDSQSNFTFNPDFDLYSKPIV